MLVKSLNTIMAPYMLAHKTGSRFWALELEEMIHASLWDMSILQHVCPRFQGVDNALQLHVDLFEKMLEARSSSLAAFHMVPPQCLDHCLSMEVAVADSARAVADELWETLLEAESAGCQGNMVKPLQYMYWRHNPAVRTLLMAYEEDKRLGIGHTPGSFARQLQQVFSKHPGDSRLVEVAHQHAKDLFRASKQNTFANTSLMAKILNSGILEKRGLQTVKPSMSDKVFARTSKQSVPVAKLLKASSHKLPKSMQDLMIPTKKKDEWPSPAPSSLFQCSAATAWLQHYWKKQKEHGWPAGVDVNTSWISVLALPGSCVAQKSTGKLMKVVATAEYSFLAWDLAVEDHQQVGRVYMMHPARANLQWHHITDMSDWAVIPTSPVLANDSQGPICWKKNGGATSLLRNICLAGLPLTVMQMKDLIAVMGGSKLPGNCSRKHAEDVLWSIAFSEDELANARASANTRCTAAAAQEEDMDSEFSEVLSELDQDEANKQDLREYTAVKKRARIKRRLGQTAEDTLLEPQKKKKGSGKARGKGRGKGQSKNHSKGRGKNKIKRKLKNKKEHLVHPTGKRRKLLDSLLQRARVKASVHAERHFF